MKNADLSTGAEVSSRPDLRRRILDTASRLFAQNGFRGTTTKEIALAAGVNEVTIFRHFASKQELYEAILDAKLVDLVDDWHQALRPFIEARDDHGLLLFIAKEILEHFHRDPDFLALKLYSSLEGHELVKKYRERQICPLFSTLRKYIVIRQQEGAFNNLNPDILVQSFLGAVYNHSMSLHFGTVSFIKLTLEETAEEFVKVLLNGVSASSATPRASHAR